MKKILFFATAIVVLLSCNKTESSVNFSDLQEIGFNTMTQNATRGYVTGTKFEQVANPDTLKTATTTAYNSTIDGTNNNRTWRKMMVSAFNVNDSTDYFKGVRFGIGTNNIWHAQPDLIYWPIGKTLKFLAYSTTENTNESSLKDSLVANWNSAKEVSFNITKAQYQNDILYAQATGNNRGQKSASVYKAYSSSASGLPITFYHAQAWLTFNITVINNDIDAQHLTIDKIVLKNVYNSGVLNIKYDDKAKTASSPSGLNTPKPDATWDFFTQNPTDVTVDDPHGVLDKAKDNLKEGSKNIGTTDVNGNGVQLNMLMPQQSHNEFILYYTMNGESNSVELPFAKATTSLDGFTQGTTTETTGYDNKTWLMGYHYIYNIQISINEITFAPNVKMWVDVTGFNPTTQEI